MNQEKIGKFISELRKEKKMTQQELANKLGVTDKAISKWENGRGLMDISMLQPLSECLDVSMIELINGERLEKEERCLKTEETIKNTLSYADNKVRKIIGSIVRVLLTVIIVLLILFGGVVYKVICATEIYYVNEVDAGEDAIYELLSMEDEIDVDSRELDESEYLDLDYFKIRNDFKDFERLDHNDNISYLINDENRGYAVTFSIGESFVNEFKTYSYNSSIGDTEERRKEFLLEKKINNDIDLFRYIRENYYMENNWFDSLSVMRNNYMINDFVGYISYGYDSMTMIKGDYDGYILNSTFKDEDTCRLYYCRLVRILDDDMVYEISFMDSEYITDEYIEDIISTLVIK